MIDHPVIQPPSALAADAARAVLRPRSPGSAAQVWVEARHFFSRADAQQHCWLWLLDANGAVHALCMDAARHGEARLSAKLRVRLARVDQPPSGSIAGGSVTWLRDAPVVPVPRWAVSWGHPLQHAIRAFASQLDQRVLDLLGWLEAPGPFFGSVGNYNRLATLPEPLRTYRMQALARFPALVPRLLLDMGNWPDLFGRDASRTAPAGASASAVLEAIDRGRDLTGALADHYGISRALVRSPLLRQPWRAGHVPGEILKLLDALPAQARPQVPGEVEDRLQCLHALQLDLTAASGVERAARLFARGWNATWDALERRVPEHLEQALRDAADFLRAALADGPLPAGFDDLEARDLGAAWLARRGALSLIEASLRWHRQPAAAAPARVTARDDIPDAVMPLIGVLEVPREEMARELVTQESLADEGVAMHHCVGSYWEECALHGDRIFHLEGSDGERATALFALEGFEGEVRYVLDQLRGPCNAAPGPAMQRLAARVMQALNHPDLAERRREAGEEARANHDRHAARRDVRAPRIVRTLDARSRQELRQVLDWCQRNPQRVRRPATLYSGNIAGFGHATGPQLLSRLAIGDVLELAREPANPYDVRAVRIDWQGRKLGYVPRASNASIAERLDRGHALQARIVRVNREGSHWNAVEVAIEPAQVLPLPAGG